MIVLVCCIGGWKLVSGGSTVYILCMYIYYVYIMYIYIHTVEPPLTNYIIQHTHTHTQDNYLTLAVHVLITSTSLMKQLFKCLHIYIEMEQS